MDKDRVWRIVYTKIYREEQAFRESLPREYISLYELLHSPNPGVYLVSGDFHNFDRADLERAAQHIPWYLHRLVKFPWVFIYRRTEAGQFFRLVKPDRWAARALNYVIDKSLAGERWELRSSEMHKVLSLFKSLIMVSLTYNIGWEREANEL